MSFYFCFDAPSNLTYEKKKKKKNYKKIPWRTLFSIIDRLKFVTSSYYDDIFFINYLTNNCIEGNNRIEKRKSFLSQCNKDENFTLMHYTRVLFICTEREREYKNLLVLQGMFVRKELHSTQKKNIRKSL